MAYHGSGSSNWGCSGELDQDAITVPGRTLTRMSTLPAVPQCRELRIGAQVCGRTPHQCSTRVRSSGGECLSGFHAQDRTSDTNRDPPKKNYRECFRLPEIQCPPCLTAQPEAIVAVIRLGNVAAVCSCCNEVDPFQPDRFYLPIHKNFKMCKKEEKKG